MSTVKAGRLLRTLDSVFGSRQGRIQGVDGKYWEVVEATHSHDPDRAQFAAAPIAYPEDTSPTIVVLVKPHEEVSDGLGEMFPLTIQDPKDGQPAGIMYCWRGTDPNLGAVRVRTQIPWLADRFKEFFVREDLGLFLPGNRSDSDRVRLTEVIAHLPDEGITDKSHLGLSPRHDGIIAYWKPDSSTAPYSETRHLPEVCGGIKIHYLRDSS